MYCVMTIVTVQYYKSAVGSTCRIRQCVPNTSVCAEYVCMCRMRQCVPTTSVCAEFVSVCRRIQCVPNTSVFAEYVSMCRMKSADEYNVCRCVEYKVRILCRVVDEFMPSTGLGAEVTLYSALSRKCHFELFRGFSSFWHFWVTLSRAGDSFSESVPVDGESYIYGPLAKETVTVSTDGHFQCNSASIRIFRRGKG